MPIKIEMMIGAGVGIVNIRGNCNPLEMGIAIIQLKQLEGELEKRMMKDLGCNGNCKECNIPEKIC